MKKWWSKKGTWLAGLMVLGALSMTGCQEKKTEIVWYLEDPQWNGVDLSEVEPFQEIQNERFDLFNKRLEELGIPAKVVFKYTEEDEEWESYAELTYLEGVRVERLIEKDEDADICEFSELEYGKFMELDSYFQEEGMQKAKAAIPEVIWEQNQIQGKTYQIPKGMSGVTETTYMFHSEFLEKYQIELEEEQIRQMTPEEVIQWLQPYFKDHPILDERFYLTSADDLWYEAYLETGNVPLIWGTTYNLAMNIETSKVYAQVWEMASLFRWIYDENIDAHAEAGRDAAHPVFRVGICDMWETDPDQQQQDESYYEVKLNQARLGRSMGNGVLKTSDKKDVAVQVLAATMYDEELSNLMIHGIQGTDYELKDGKVVYMDENADTTAGSYSQVGNNFIAFPKEAEIMDKKHTIEQRLESIKMNPKSNFVPTWTKEMWKQATGIVEVCSDIWMEMAYSDVDNMEAYRKEQEQKLEDLGINELIAELQKQVEQWED